jgi:Cys-tRNA(Pro)/Cys-tRNA(Cys) deacylase
VGTARRGKQSAATPAIAELLSAGVRFDVHEFDVDPSARNVGLAVAAATGADPARVFKTLVVSTDRGLAVAIVGVQEHASMKALAAALGAKRAELGDRVVAERVTGYVRGGISPFGQKRRLPTVVDRRVLEFPTICVSGGRRGLELELAGTDLVRLLDATIADLVVSAT